MSSGDAIPSGDSIGYFEGYASFARTLRAWLVAYGVGGPALILTQEQLSQRFLASGDARLITGLFLGGVAAQVAGALLYKTAMWYLYLGELKNDFKAKARYRVADWISEAFLIEVVLDLASIVVFGWATYMLLTLFDAAGSR